MQVAGAERPGLFDPILENHRNTPGIPVTCLIIRAFRWFRPAKKKAPNPFGSEAILFGYFCFFLFGCFCVPRRYCVIRIANTAAHIQEATAPAVVKRASTTRMIREAGARGNQAADNDVLLQST